eukprot:2657176-Rhodomonas_salina.1
MSSSLVSRLPSHAPLSSRRLEGEVARLREAVAGREEECDALRTALDALGDGGPDLPPLPSSSSSSALSAPNGHHHSASASRTAS